MDIKDRESSESDPVAFGELSSNKFDYFVDLLVAFLKIRLQNSWVFHYQQ